VDVGSETQGRGARVFLHRVGTCSRERGRSPGFKISSSGASSGSRTAIPAEAGDYVADAARACEETSNMNVCPKD